MEKRNSLIVYFSYTGHTKMIANMIKEKINCDIVELKPIKPYSTNYQEVVDDEQNSEASNIIPEIQKVDVDLSKYDKIIIGTPTWWYRPAPVVRAFLKNYDLSGKVIIPFSTNAGWLGKTFKEIEELSLLLVLVNTDTFVSLSKLELILSITLFSSLYNFL